MVPFSDSRESENREIRKQNIKIQFKQKQKQG